MPRRYVASILLLTAVLLLAATMRIYHIDLLSLWIDEGFSFYLTQWRDPLQMLVLDVHPPLYFLLLDGWVELAGISELALRYLSVLPAMLSVAVIYQLAREIERQRGRDSRGFVPITAALLLAISSAEIFLAQEVRSYTLHNLLAVLSMWAMLRWGRRGGRGWLIVWIISNAANLYTFYLAGWLMAAQGLYVLIAWTGRRRIMGIGALALASALVIPWLLFTLGQQSGNLSYANWIRPEQWALEDLRLRYWTGQWALTLALAFFGCMTLLRGGGWRWRPVGPWVLLLLWAFLPLILTFAANEFVPLYTARRVSQVAPAVALLVAFGLGNLRGAARPLILVALLVYGLGSVDFWYPKQPWRAMAEQTAPLIAPDELVLFEVGGDDYAPYYHWLRTLPPGENTLRGLTTWRHLEPETYEAGLPALIDAHDHVWLFYWSSDESAFAWLNTLDFARTATVTVDFNPNVFFYRYDRLQGEALSRYENGLILRDARLRPESMTVDLWWSAEGTLDHDYVVSAYLLNDAGQLVAQWDSQPFLDQHPMTGWEAGETIYDPRILRTMDGAPLSPGTYQAGVVVYWFAGDGSIQRLPLMDGRDAVPLGDFIVAAD